MDRSALLVQHCLIPDVVYIKIFISKLKTGKKQHLQHAAFVIFDNLFRFFHSINAKINPYTYE